MLMSEELAASAVSALYLIENQDSLVTRTEIAQLAHEVVGRELYAADALNAIPYAGMAVVCAGYKRDRVAHPLDGFGFLVPRDGSLRMLGCLWTSSIFPHQAPPDGVLLRTMLGGATDPDILSLTGQYLPNVNLLTFIPLFFLLLQVQSRPRLISDPAPVSWRT